MTLEPLTPDTLREGAKQLLRKRRALVAARRSTDIVDWAHKRYYVIDEDTREARLITLEPVQQGVLRVVMQQDEAGHLRHSTAIISTIKKAGKTTLAGIIARFVAEVRTAFGEVYCIGNDFNQARDRAFESAKVSIHRTPGAVQHRGEWVLPHEWICQATLLNCLSSGTKVKPIAVDARGEAGGNPDLTVWTELWGFEYKEALDFWAEMTPVPTKRDSMRLVETYAGFDGESKLLRGQFDLAQAGRQMTNHEFALIASRTRIDKGLTPAAIAELVPEHPDEYNTFLSAFVECDNDPNALVPIWVNEGAGVVMYYDSGPVARRVPWLRGERGEQYYREQESNLTPQHFLRMHHNLWVGGEGEFVPLTSWDALTCEVTSNYTGAPNTLPVFAPDKTPIVLGVDAATTGDCFGIVAVTRHPTIPRNVAVRAVRVWEPPPNGRIDYAEPEAFLRLICKTYNVVQIAYDPYQLESMMQTLRADHVAWCEEFNQGMDRLTADRGLYDLIINQQIWHDGDRTLREHIGNANVKLQKDEDSKMRIVKRTQSRKIDLVVALSMAASRCLYLTL